MLCENKNFLGLLSLAASSLLSLGGPRGVNDLDAY